MKGIKNRPIDLEWFALRFIFFLLLFQHLFQCVAGKGVIVILHFPALVLGGFRNTPLSFVRLTDWVMLSFRATKSVLLQCNPRILFI
ncbi:hypothetical protein OAJ57_02925 [Alphaproteobacteria bacterium]|nr:hypothetical protein [Alphaproteobacteria bacterium]